MFVLLDGSDGCTHETTLDGENYQKLLALEGPKLIDNASGWDQTFTTQQANTTVIRSLGVSKGSVTLRNLVIRP